jgi:hypothetical protein
MELRANRLKVVAIRSGHWDAVRSRMISRSELEALIVDRLIEIRRAEVMLKRRFRQLIHSQKGRAELASSLTDLDVRAERLELMLNALASGEASAPRPAAA